MELAEEMPERQAVIFRKEILTYRELAARARAIGRYLAACGVRKGDRVLFSAVSKPETVAVYLACLSIGAVSVFIDKNSTVANALSIYDEAGASLFLTDMKFGEVPAHCRLASLKTVYKEAGEQCANSSRGSAVKSVSQMTASALGCVELDPEDISEILFTTGTTGRPKGVMLSHRATLSILTHTRDGIGITGDDRILIPLPLHHSFSLRVLRACLYCGGTVVLQNGLTFAREVESNQAAFGCTGMAAVPVSMELLRAQMQDSFYEIMGRFRYIEIGAGSLTVEQRKRLAANLPNTVIHNTWGSSETGGALFTNITEIASDPVLVTAVGKPLPDIEVRVLGSEGEVIAETGLPRAGAAPAGHAASSAGGMILRTSETAPASSPSLRACTGPDHTGRLALRGEMLMSGYWGQEALTRETLVDGWLLTNDVVYMDESGYFHMLGRSDDIINVGGEKVSPIEVENIAGEFPAIAECACIGVPDTVSGLGQVPVLVYVAEAEIPDGELRAFLASRMEKYKIPAHFIRVEAVPRNRMQKIDRKGIRALWDARGEAE